MQTDTNLIILDSAVDWLTITAKRGAPADALHTRAHGLLHQSVSAGNLLSIFRANGYRGEKAGGVSYGRRHDGSILTLTSCEAARSALSFLGDDYHVTRLDLQITCADETTCASRAEIAYHLLQDSSRRRGRPISASLRINSYGGQTLYLGKPSSDVIARLYDKGIEKKIAQAGACWRYETQYRRDSAGRVSTALRESEAVHDCIATLVATHFSTRGVAVPKVKGDFAPSHLQSEIYYSKREETDNERSLRWLSTFVASTVERLIDCGRRDDVLRALGLDDKERVI
jgi:hypothetical protein